MLSQAPVESRKASTSATPAATPHTTQELKRASSADTNSTAVAVPRYRRRSMTRAATFPNTNGSGPSAQASAAGGSRDKTAEPIVAAVCTDVRDAIAAILQHNSDSLDAASPATPTPATPRPTPSAALSVSQQAIARSALYWFENNVGGPSSASTAARANGSHPITGRSTAGADWTTAPDRSRLLRITHVLGLVMWCTVSDANSRRRQQALRALLRGGGVDRLLAHAARVWTQLAQSKPPNKQQVRSL